MCNDDSRGNESSDRRDASPDANQRPDYRPFLEVLHTHITNLRDTVNDDPTLDPPTRRAARRHCRELRAELEWVRRELPDPPENALPPITRSSDAVTVVKDPSEATLEAARRRSELNDPYTESGGEDGD
ncbi:hypothetical protein C477_21235 [Haloterrigena salina JCM 13891]|uniref:Uncharacterized protein n=1 Tax=Haloterrigena salina JCM 13891 TaxID=1227488 RepID=M0BT20_9EURY|nr:hypothetical protein [Haloterrigena salina]ELZ14085.1 hypothetical protein C477_21235 [Haloterrigena salina JCM 13891]